MNSISDAFIGLTVGPSIALLHTTSLQFLVFAVLDSTQILKTSSNASIVISYPHITYENTTLV